MKKAFKTVTHKVTKRNILRDFALEAVPGIFGTIKAYQSDPLGLTSRLIQRVAKNGIYEGVEKEWKSLKETEKIKDDYGHTAQGRVCLTELLDCLDADILDDVRIDTMRKIFFIVAQEKISDRDNPTPQLLMKVCRKLESHEIMVLLASYAIYKATEFSEQHYDIHNWAKAIAAKSGLLDGLVYASEDKLIKCGLIADRTHSDRSGIGKKETFRLTDLGIEMGKYVSASENAKG